MNKQRICIIGIGGGGSKIVEWTVPLATEGPRLAIINTDTRALDDCKVPRKIKIGQLFTGGTGTGGNVDAGRKSAEEDIEKIKPLFARMDLVIFVAALGGGTGSGALPVALKEAAANKCLTLCFVTTPFTFEGKERSDIAQNTIKEISEIADGVIQIPNDSLFDSVGRYNVSQSFLKADETVSTAIKGIWKLITSPGYINLDFANLSYIIKGASGICSLAYGNGKGHNKAQNAIRELLESPLTKHGELLKNAAVIMVSIVGGEDLALKEVGDIMEAIQQSANTETKISMGTVIDSAWRNKLMITVIFADSWTPQHNAGKQAPSEEPKDKSGVQEMLPLEDSPKPTGKSSITRKRKNAQKSLSITSGAINRFKGTSATIIDGEDLDIPTFKRRKIKIPE